MTALFCWYRTARILGEDLEPEGQSERPGSALPGL